MTVIFSSYMFSLNSIFELERLTMEAGLSDNIVNYIFQDSQGFLWICTEDDLNRYDGYDFTVFSSDVREYNSLWGSVVKTIMEDQDGKLWIGTQGKGISVYDPNRNKFAHYKHNPSDPSSLGHDNVSFIFQDSFGIFWISLDNNRVQRFIEETSEFNPYSLVPEDPNSISSPFIYDVYEDNYGLLWFRTSKGVCLFNRSDESFKYYLEESVGQILEDRSGDLWLTTSNRLYRYDRKMDIFSHQWTSPSDPFGRYSNVIRAWNMDKAGRFWIATGYSGLGQFDRKNRVFIKYNYDSGDKPISGNLITHMLEDRSGILWIGMQHEGLCKIIPKDVLTNNQHIPPVVLTSFKIFNEEQDMGKNISLVNEVKLTYKQNLITIEFAALDFVEPEKNQYAYKLEGLDDDWVQLGNRRFVTLTNLDPGENVFRVKGSNNTGLWNEEGITLKIVVKPPFWKTWWFYSLCVVSMLSGIFGYVSIRLNHLRREKIRLEQKVQDRTEGLREQSQELQVQTQKLQTQYEKIKKRTSDLNLEIERREQLEENLKIARDKAEEANITKSQFLANMSHEIRSPLNAIVGFSQILINQSSKYNLPDLNKNYLKNIKIGGQNLTEIINDILDLSKIEAGKMTLSEEDINLKQLIRNIFHLNKTHSMEKGVIYNFNIEPGVPEIIRADGTKLKKILMNLIDNAVKFTPANKGVLISVSLNENQEIMFTIKDEGIGIPNDRLAVIFDPFEQGDSITSKDYGGTGLGLSITKKMVELMKGEISIVSESGLGSTFTVKIPYKQPDAVERVESEIELREYKFSPDNKVLAVEDNAMNQEMLRALFNELNIELIIAENGKEGVSKAFEHQPDLILMDIHMPVMDGYTATRLIRENPALAEIPIVALTADAFKEQKRKALKSGINAYISKPLDLQEFMPMLKKYLKPLIT